MKKIIFRGFCTMCLAHLYTFLINHINSIYKAFAVRCPRVFTSNRHFNL